MSGGPWDLADVLVTIGVSAGVAEVPLTDWMAGGPGPRNMTRPESPRSRSTGEELPPTVIPLAYRNDRESRALIAAGRIASPWTPGSWNYELWPPPSCEVYGPWPFDGSVDDPSGVDRLVVRALSAAGAGDARLLLERVPEFAEAAPVVVRRLVAEARWADLEVTVPVAAAAGLVEVAPVLVEVLESDARPARFGHLVDALGQLRHEPAARLLRSLVAQFVYPDADLASARRCLRALAAIGKPRARFDLAAISWEDWPGPIAEWADQELAATGQQMPIPGRGLGRDTSRDQGPG